MSIDNDTMAFPMVVPNNWESYQQGMSLRDWFAGQALAGIMANPNLRPLSDSTFLMIVDRAYLLGQMMMDERKKGE